MLADSLKSHSPDVTGDDRGHRPGEHGGGAVFKKFVSRTLGGGGVARDNFLSADRGAPLQDGVLVVIDLRLR